MLSYGYIFHMGFMNYYLSLGLACIGLALRLARTQEWTDRRRHCLRRSCCSPTRSGFLWFLGTAVYRFLWLRLPGAWRLVLPAAGLADSGWHATSCRPSSRLRSGMARDADLGTQWRGSISCIRLTLRMVHDCGCFFACRHAQSRFRRDAAPQVLEGSSAHPRTLLSFPSVPRRCCQKIFRPTRPEDGLARSLRA